MTIPDFSFSDFIDGFNKANASPRRRYPKILHNQGAYENKVIHFICNDSYMQPHLHPGNEKNEIIYLLYGKCAVLYFNDDGCILNINILDHEKINSIDVAAFTWHTYVMLSDFVVTYETMNGVYDPITFRKSADWAPKEADQFSVEYLKKLKNACSLNFGNHN